MAVCRRPQVAFIFFVVASAGLLKPLIADEEAPSRVKSRPAVSPGEAVRLAKGPIERAKTLAVFRRRMLELDLDAWQALVDGDFDAASEAKAEELSQTKIALGDADSSTQFAAWGAESFNAVRKLPAERREIVHQAARSDRSGQRLKAQGTLERARVHFELASKNFRDVLGVQNQITIYGINRLSEVESSAGDFESAYSKQTEIFEAVTQKLDAKTTFAVWACGQLACAEEKVNRTREAEARFQRVVKLIEPLLADNPELFVSQIYALAHQHLARLANDRGESTTAESHARQALAVLAAEYALNATPESRIAVVLAEIELAISCAGQGRMSEADRAFDSVLRFMYSWPEETAPVDVQIRVLSNLAEQYRRSKRTRDAENIEAKLAVLTSSENAPGKPVERTAAGDEKKSKRK